MAINILVAWLLNLQISASADVVRTMLDHHTLKSLNLFLRGNHRSEQFEGWVLARFFYIYPWKHKAALELGDPIIIGYIFNRGCASL